MIFKIKRYFSSTKGKLILTATLSAMVAIMIGIVVCTLFGVGMEQERKIISCRIDPHFTLIGDKYCNDMLLNFDPNFGIGVIPYL